MENTPEAAPQNTGTEAQPTNTNQTETSAPAEQTQTQAPDLHGLTNEQVSEMAKFVEANGGYEKAFKTFKDRISNPAQEQPKTEVKQEDQEAPKEPVQAQNTPSKTPAGYMSRDEFLAQQYYNSLANQPEFAPIADKIRSGEVFNEMRKFGIRPMDENGNLNDVQAREFLSLLAKTVPAAPAKTPEEAAAPTVDYIPVNDGKIENYNQAAQIIAQSSKLTASGQAPHPSLQAAEDYIRNFLAPGKK